MLPPDSLTNFDDLPSTSETSPLRATNLLKPLQLFLILVLIPSISMDSFVNTVASIPAASSESQPISSYPVESESGGGNSTYCVIA